MIKVLTGIKMKAGLTDEEFLHYWKEKHGPLFSKIVPGVRRYVQCHPVKVPGIEHEFDGIAEVWWDDLESYKNYFMNWRPSEEGEVLREDEKKFIDTSQMVRFVAEEKVIIDNS